MEQEEEEELQVSAVNTSHSTLYVPTSAAGDFTSLSRQDRTMVEFTEVQQQNMVYFHASLGSYQSQEDLDSDDDEEEEAEDEEDEDEDEEERNVDLTVEEIPPSLKRRKVTNEMSLQIKEDSFWVAFDSQVVVKSVIELLNTTLSKLAHSKVVLLNQPAIQLDRVTAIKKLKSVGPPPRTSATVCEMPKKHQQSLNTGNRIAGVSLLNEKRPLVSKEIPDLPLTDSLTTTLTEKPTSMKRKLADASSSEAFSYQGFFAHFFSIGELDMVWRTVMHAHLFKGRFGERIEFHTASAGVFSKRDFDELTYLSNSAVSSRAASLGFSPMSSLKCCIFFPCLANEEEMFRVGRNAHSLLKMQGSLYYRVLDPLAHTSASTSSGGPHELLNEAENMTEESFRQYARYRVMKKEPVIVEHSKPNKFVVDFKKCQESQETRYCLEVLDNYKWTSCHAITR